MLNESCGKLVKFSLSIWSSCNGMNVLLDKVGLLSATAYRRDLATKANGKKRPSRRDGAKMVSCVKKKYLFRRHFFLHSCLADIFSKDFFSRRWWLCASYFGHGTKSIGNRRRNRFFRWTERKRGLKNLFILHKTRFRCQCEKFQVRLNREMFFFVSDGLKDLQLHDACIVEAAARLHPTRRVFVLFITPDVTDVFKSKSLSALLSYENIFLRHIKLKK